MYYYVKLEGWRKMRTNGRNVLKLLHLAAAADGHIDESEMAMIHKLHLTYVPLTGISDHEIKTIAQSCFTAITNGTSNKELIRELTCEMSDKVKQLSYALAIEVCGANFNISNDENSFLVAMKEVLQIPEDVSDAVLTSARIRYELEA
jgi:uncharacterized membrane protein YebE (DUF533 family)